MRARAESSRRPAAPAAVAAIRREDLERAAVGAVARRGVHRRRSQARGGAARAPRATRVRRTLQRRAAERRGRRRDRAGPRRAPGRGSRAPAAPVDAPVLGPAPAEVAAAREVLRRERRAAVEQPRQLAAQQHLGGRASRARTPRPASVVVADRHRLLADDAARRRAWRPSRAAWRRSRARRRRTAQFTGARPRYCGRSEPCMLKAPRRAVARTAGGSMRR